MDVPRTRAISALHVPEALLPHLLAQCALDDTHGAWKITHVIRTHQGEGIPGHAQPDRRSHPASLRSQGDEKKRGEESHEQEEVTAHEEHRIDPLTRRGYASLVQCLSQTATLLVAFDYGRPYDAHVYERVLDAAIDAQVSFLLFISLMTSADDEGATPDLEFVARHRQWKERISERTSCHHAWVHTVPSFQDLLLWNFPHHLDAPSPSATPSRPSLSISSSSSSTTTAGATGTGRGVQPSPGPDPPSSEPDPDPLSYLDTPPVPEEDEPSLPEQQEEDLEDPPPHHDHPDREEEKKGMMEDQKEEDQKEKEGEKERAHPSPSHENNKAQILRSPFSEDQEVALVDCADVARAILAIVQDPSDHAEQEYQITGRETLTVGGLMHVLNQATEDYDFVYEQDNSLESWAQAGYHPDWSQLVLQMIAQDHPGGLLQVISLVSDDVEELTGELPHTIEEFIPDLLVVLQEQWSDLQLAPHDTVDLSHAIAVAQPPSEELQRLQELCQDTARSLEQLVVEFQMDCERQTSRLLSLFPEERDALADWTDDPSQIRELEGSQTVILRSLAVLQRTVESLPAQVQHIATRYKDTMERRVQQYEEALLASSSEKTQDTPRTEEGPPTESTTRAPPQSSPPSLSSSDAQRRRVAFAGSPPVSLERDEGYESRDSDSREDKEEERTEGSRQPRQPLSRHNQPQLGTPTHAGEPGVGFHSTLGEESSRDQTLPFSAQTSARQEAGMDDASPPPEDESSEGEKRKRRKVGRIRHKIRPHKKDKKDKKDKKHRKNKESTKKKASGDDTHPVEKPTSSSHAGDMGDDYQKPTQSSEENHSDENEERGPRGNRRPKTKRERATAARLHTFQYGHGSVNSSSVSYSSSFSSSLSFSSDSTSDEMPYMNKDEDEVESLMRGEYEHRDTQAAPEPLFLPLRPQQFADEMEPKDYFHRFIRVEESSSLDVADLPEAFDNIPQVDGERRLDELGIPSTRPRRADRHSRKTCSICESHFSVINRRYHCRACGELVDRQCAKNKMVLPNLRYFKPVRICKDCKVLYEKRYKPLMSTA